MSLKQTVFGLVDGLMSLVKGDEAPEVEVYEGLSMDVWSYYNDKADALDIELPD